MAIPTPTLPKFPIDPANSAQEMQRLSDAIEQLQRNFADNFRPHPLPAPRPSLPVVVKITGTTVASVTLGTNWYTGQMQLPPRPHSATSFDPATTVDMGSLYSPKSLTDDCYILSPFNATITAGSYFVGELQGLAKPSSQSLPVRPVIIITGSPAAAQTLGQYQYMVSQMTAQNIAGWDFVRAHPLL